MDSKSVVKQQKTPHRWKKGECGNPNGRPRKPEVEILRDALEKAKIMHGRHFIEHFVRKAYTDDQIAIALAKKLLPDKFENFEERPKMIVRIIKGYCPHMNQDCSKRNVTVTPAERPL